MPVPAHARPQPDDNQQKMSFYVDSKKPSFNGEIIQNGTSSNLSSDKSKGKIIAEISLSGKLQSSQDEKFAKAMSSQDEKF